MKYFFDFFKGILIGSGAILPGISSGVICVIFGIYENLINCILNFFKNIKQNLKFLFPIGFGALVGIILFGNILKYLFLAYPIQIKFIFIGLILGTTPSLFKTACSKEKFKIKYLAFTIICFLIGISLVFLEKNLTQSNFSNSYNFLYLVLCGFLMSAGVVIPGVSSTLILMLLGIYNAYLASISNLFIPFLLPLCIGLFVGSIFFMKLTQILLNKFYEPTFFSIIGFTLGSILVLYPRF